MTADLKNQIRDYFEYVDAEQDPVDLAELQRLDVDRPAIAAQSGSGPTRRGWTYAVVAAVLTFVAIGGVSLLLSPDEIEPADISTPITETTTPTPSTSTPMTPQSSGFAPSVEGIGLEEPGAFTIQQREIEAFGETFVFVEATWSVDWKSITSSLVDDEARQSMSSAGLAAVWHPETNTVEFEGQVSSSDFETYAVFELGFAGTSDDWEVPIHHQATGASVGLITGSLPGLAEEEILARLGFGFSTSRAAWLLEIGGDDPEVLDTPWARFHGLSPWSTPVELFVVGDAMLAFGITDHDANDSQGGSWNVWRSPNGRDWEDLGALPWSTDTYSVDRLDVIGDQVVVLLRIDGVDEHEFFVTSDGSEWSPISEEEYEELTGRPVFGPDENPVPPDQPVEALDNQRAVDERFSSISQGAGVLSEDPFMVQPLPGPEPRFDSSSLGEEIPFSPLTPDHALVQELAAGFYDFIDPLPLPTGAIVFVGHVSEALGGYRLFWPTATNGYCEATPADGGGGCPGSRGIVPEAGEAVFEDDGLVVVPLDASVVVLRYNADTSLWQRPTGGWAIFPTAVDGDDTYWIDVYDADGNLMATTEE